MGHNLNLRELVEIFRGSLEEDIISGVYHDMHGNGQEAIQILQQLQNSMGIKVSHLDSNLPPNPRPSEGGTENKMTNFVNRNQKPFKVSNSLRDRRLNPDKIKIPGYHDRKALYLMRGLSGSGKSTYARKIVGELGRGEIFSTDDFFMLNEANEYRFVSADLEIAHKWNQQRVEGALSEGISPVVVDNTNTQFWEMRPYVIAGVEKGYKCYFIEPPTEWKFKINQLYRKSKHGLNKAQLVAALKRYEKNPTVEKVIGPAYLSKMKHSHCAGESSSAAGYIPFTSVKTDKGANNKKGDASLVPYILSDSSDEPNDHEKFREKQDSVKDQDTSVNYREYNNNSTCPKVISEANPPSRAAWDKGSGNLGISGKQSLKPKTHKSSYQKKEGDCAEIWGEKSEFSEGDSSDNGDWDQDMSAWLADMEAREIEDELLDKLEKQESGDLGEDLSEIIDIQKQREESVKKLSTWGPDVEVKIGIPQGCTSDKTHEELPEGKKDSEEVSENEMDIPDLELSDSDDECDKEVDLEFCSGRLSCEPSNSINYVSRVFTLVEICRRKLKTVLKVSYLNSAHYWNAHEEARKLPVLRCHQVLPPPSPQPDNDGTSSSTDLVISLEELEPYVVVTEDNIVVSPSRPLAPKRCVKQSLKSVSSHGKIADERLGIESDSDRLDARILTQKEEEIIKIVQNIIGSLERDKLISVCEECEWDEEEILECLLLKESLREITEETIKEESLNLSKLLQSEPPSIRSLLNVGDTTGQSESDTDKLTDESGSGASKVRYDSKEDVEVTTLTLSHKVVNDLTEMFGQIVGLPRDRNITIPVNSELASQLHSALYFAQIDGKIPNSHRGKEKMRPLKLQKRNPPPVVPTSSTVPFNEIVQYQKKLPERKGKMKKLVAAYPGMDEKFLEEILSSCGNDLQRALNVLSTDSVRLTYLDDEEKLYSTKTEYTPERTKRQTAEYTQLTQTPHYNNYSSSNIIIPPGTLVEQAEAYRELSGHNLSQAKVWHSKKRGLVAGHYAKQGATYRELAEDAEMKIFGGTIVKDKLRELKLNPVLDLHGLTLSQSKYLLREAFDHFKLMIAHDPEFPKTLSVITGKGLHSSGGVPRLKLGIKALLNTQAIPYNEEPDGYKIKFRS